MPRQNIISPRGNVITPRENATNRQASSNRQFVDGGGGGSTDDMTFIQEIALDSSQTFSAIPGTYRHLWVIFIAACNQAAAQVLSIRFNADSGTNYAAQSGGASQGSLIAAQLTGQAQGRIGSVSGTGDPAGTFTSGRFFIPYYAATVNDKVALCASYYNDASNGPLLRNDDAQWTTANAAITSITFVPGAGSFISGSKASLYGVT